MEFRRSESNADVLDMEIIPDPFQASLTADAALFDASRRRLNATNIPAIDPDRSGSQLARHAQGAADILRVNPGHQPIGHIVGDL